MTYPEDQKLSGFYQFAGHVRYLLRTILVCCAAFFAFPDILQSQTIVGRSVVEGRNIEILSDRTWRYKSQENAEAKCDVLPLGLQFCGTATWIRTTPPSTEIAAQYRFGDRNYGQFVAEALGSDDGMSTKFMKKAAITRAARGTNVQESDVPILDVRAIEIDGKPAETTVYQLTFEGLDAVFLSTIVVRPKSNFQVQTFGVGTEETPRMTELRQEFVDFVRIK